MNPEWITAVVLICFFVYALTSALIVMSYIILRWRKMRLTFEQVAYFVGGCFVLVGGSMTYGLAPRPSGTIFLSIFFFAQGAAVMFLGYCKEWRDKRRKQGF